MNVAEQEVNAGMQWTAIALTHVEYQKGFVHMTPNSSYPSLTHLT